MYLFWIKFKDINCCLATLSSITEACLGMTQIVWIIFKLTFRSGLRSDLLNHRNLACDHNKSVLTHNVAKFVLKLQCNNLNWLKSSPPASFIQNLKKKKRKWHNIFLFQLFGPILFSAYVYGSFAGPSNCWCLPPYLNINKTQLCAVSTKRTSECREMSLNPIC